MRNSESAQFSRHKDFRRPKHSKTKRYTRTRRTLQSPFTGSRTSLGTARSDYSYLYLGKALESIYTRNRVGIPHFRHARHCMSHVRMLNVIGNVTSVLCMLRSTQHAHPSRLPVRTACTAHDSAHREIGGSPLVVTRALDEITHRTGSVFARGLFRGYSVSTLISSRQPTQDTAKHPIKPWHAARLHASSHVAMLAPVTISLPTDP